MKKISFALLIFSLSMLSACDRGAKAVRVIKTEYKTVFEQEFNEESIQAARQVVLLLRAVAQAYPEKGSGQEAKQLLAAIKAKASAYRDIQLPKMEAAKVKAYGEVDEFEKSAIVFRAKYLKKKGDVFAKFKHKVGDCIGMYSGGEFPKEPVFTHVRVFRIEEVGKDEFLARPVYQGYLDDLKHPKEALERGRESEGKSQFTYASSPQVDCLAAEKLATQYHDLMNEIVGAQEFAKRVGQAEALME